MIVIDASVALAWLFEDETTESDEDILRLVLTGSAIVPALWHLEVSNTLVMAERRKRLESERVSLALQQLASLPIQTDDLAAALQIDRVLPLARAEGLTTYDAAYLELALRLALPLATRDRELKLAAGRRSIPLLAT